MLYGVEYSPQVMEVFIENMALWETAYDKFIGRRQEVGNQRSNGMPMPRQGSSEASISGQGSINRSSS